ncbi:MAG: D-cysteine desulfhydrase family protein [Nannocystaceae bacterium]
MVSNFAFPPRLDLAQLPTPVTELPRLSRAWDSPRLWVKRDDDTGGPLSGNKVRKLAYIVREAIDQGADTLITCGAVASNHCRATAIVARRLGLEPVLVLRGEKPTHPQGNYLIDCLLGAETHFVSHQAFAKRHALFERLVREKREQGRKAYVIDTGASVPLGSWGYIEACAEIRAAQEELGITFDAIVHAAGSGGTSCGLELGVRLFGLSARPWAVNVCDDEVHFRKEIHRLARATALRFKLPVTVAADEIGILDGHVGPGYGRSTPELRAFLGDVARTEGLLLDPTYSGKALHGLHRELQTERFRDAKNILFLHTGGMFGLFAAAPDLA